MPWVGQKPFGCSLKKTKILKRGMKLSWAWGCPGRGEQSACRSSQCFPSPRLQHLNGFLCLLGCEDASFCMCGGTCRTYGLVLPLCEPWMGIGLWPCCRDSMAVIAAGWMPSSLLDGLGRSASLTLLYVIRLLGSFRD